MATQQNTLEGKLYAVDTQRSQIAVYVTTQGGYKPAWQTVSSRHLDEVKGDMQGFIMYREGGMIFYDCALQMAVGHEYLAVKEAASKLLSQRQAVAS